MCKGMFFLSPLLNYFIRKPKSRNTSEQELYFFLNRSDKPKAIPFQKWIVSEVDSWRSYSLHP
ncbi:BRO-N domain-containing protein [Candidatus Liberibacter asiaticus]|uniref:BRO-N domain-containing protein n=2 Tax=Liberibacter asiaticus TaxID=34021 RepID=UPI003CC780D0